MEIENKKKYKLFSAISFVVLICFVFFAINSTHSLDINFNEEKNNILKDSKDTNLVFGVGTVTYLPFEGGFFGIISQDGQKFEPCGLPLEYQVDGLKVIFVAQIKEESISFHMWGNLVDLIYIISLY